MTKPTYDHEKIKDLIIKADSTEPLPTYTLTGIHLRSLDTDSEGLEDSAIEVAARIMRDALDEDPKLALDAAKATMSWMGKGSKSRTTIFANNAQVNQLTENPKASEHILKSLKDSIGLITDGQQVIGDV